MDSEASATPAPSVCTDDANEEAPKAKQKIEYNEEELKIPLEKG